jgi:nitroreductase
MGAKTKKQKKRKKEPVEFVRDVPAPDPAPGEAPLTALDAIARRRTHKHYTARPVTRAEIAALLDAAVLAPNHKMTEPWRFVVPGPSATRAWAELRADFKVGAGVADDAGRAEAKRAKLVEEALAVPAYIVVLMYQDDDAFRRDEDHAAVWMAVQNLLLAATALGLGTKIATGRVFETDAARTLFGAKKRERVLGVVHVGEPAETRVAKERTPATTLTTWLE